MKKNKERIFLIIAIIVLSLVLCVLGFIIGKKLSDSNEPNGGGNTEDGEFSYTPIMYKICDNNNCNYLLGSMHIGDKRINKYSKIILDAYNEMNEIALEIDPDEMENYNIAEYLSGDALKDVIDEELDAKLEEFFTKNKMSYETIKEMPIGFVYLLIDNQVTTDTKLTEPGPDTFFGKKAKADNKPINSFETVEFQMNLLTNYSNEYYIYIINETLDNYDEAVNSLKQMYDYYLNADIDNIKKLLQTDNATQAEEEFSKELFDNRNIPMAEKIEEFLSEDKNVFIVVGLGHVIGENGIIDLLSNKEYKINLVK